MGVNYYGSGESTTLENKLGFQNSDAEIEVTPEGNLKVNDTEGSHLFRPDSKWWYVQDFKQKTALDMITSANATATDNILTPLVGSRSVVLGFTGSGTAGDFIEMVPVAWPEFSKTTKVNFLYRTTGDSIYECVVLDSANIEIGRKRIPSSTEINSFSHIVNRDALDIKVRIEVVSLNSTADTFEIDRIRFTDDAFETGETVITNEISLSGNNGEANAGFSGNIPYNGTGQGWDSTNREYTVQFNNSTVHITAWALLNSSFPSLGMSLFVNGVQVGYVGNSTSSTSNTGGTLVINEEGFGSLSKLKKGDKISVRVNQSGNFRNNAGDERFHYLNILETAKTDNVVIEGNTLPSLTETKILSSSVTTNGPISDWTFSDLKIGDTYTLLMQVSGIVTNDTTATITAINGSQTKKAEQGSNSNVSGDWVISWVFTAESDTLSFTSSNFASGTFIESGQFIQLTKERTNAIVQVPQNKGLNSIGLAGNGGETVGGSSQATPFAGSGLGWSGDEYTMQFSDSLVNLAFSIRVTSAFTGTPQVYLIKNGVFYKTVKTAVAGSTVIDGRYISYKGEFSKDDTLALSLNQSRTLDNDIAQHYLNITEESPQTVFIGEASPERYSTAEIDTGKVWIDGKPIYRRVWISDVTTGATGVIETLATGLTPIRIQGTFRNLVNQWLPFNLDTTSATVAVDYNDSTGALTRFHNAYTITGYRLIMEYTK